MILDLEDRRPERHLGLHSMRCDTHSAPPRFSELEKQQLEPATVIPTA